MTRQLDDLTPAAIKAAVMAVFPERGWAESHHLLGPVAELLESSRQAVPQGYAGRRAQDRFSDRVKRALDSIAKEGLLVRVGAKDEPPDGNSAGSVIYWTPEAYAAAKTQHQARITQSQDYDRRMHKIEERLAAVGFMNGTELTLAEWEQLLSLAGL